MPYHSTTRSKVKKADAAYKKSVKTSKLGEGKRFAAGSKAVQARGKSKKQADAIMAVAGRKKYGAKKFSKMSAN